jgi:RNA polymerase sigma-70 factor, ECF subfamily
MESFLNVYNQFNKQVFNFINQSINYKSEIAEEITQDIFVKIASNLDIFDDSKSSLKTWVFNISKNTLIDHYRTNKTFTINVGSYKDENGNESFQFVGNTQADTEILNEEKMNSINKAFEKLTGLTKRVAELSLLEQRSYNEVADILDIPLGTVKGTLLRAKNQLKSVLQKQPLNNLLEWY